MKSITKVATTVGMALLPLISFAQVTQPVTAPITSITTVPRLLTSILGWFQVIFFSIAAIFIVLAAFQYLTAGGDEEKVKSAKQMVIYAVVAIAVAVMATAVQGIVVSLLRV
ncbi:hypothetical protein HY967_04615 [Candidatus Jorgensenbacteria bacterium]|nr:hypothetical protein [Candidatus Jorgensenbacteria bacterium]